MASFPLGADVGQRLDWVLLQNGFVTLFWNNSIFGDTQDELDSEGYQVIGLDATGWTTDERMYDDISAAFDLPGYFGRNLNAVVDCLRDVARFDYGADPTATGTVVAIERIDALGQRSTDLARQLLDVLADAGRYAMLFGHRFIVLAQTDDPAISLGPLGATTASWNRAEWLNSSRGV